MLILLYKSPYQISKNFKSREFFTKCLDYSDIKHVFDDRLIKAAQIIRDFIRHPVRITSSYRTASCNAKCGGAPNSYHLHGEAVDLSCPCFNKVIADAISNKQPLYSQLRKIGINGFGISDKFIHLDVRPSGSCPDSFYGSYEIWHY